MTKAYFETTNPTVKFYFYVFVDGAHEADKSSRGIDFLFANI